MEKMTYVKALEVAINGMADGEVKDKLIALKGSIEKKNASKGDRKPTATQKENVGIKASILEILEDGALTITEIVKALDGDYTNQKVSALVRQLVADGSVVRFEEKRKAYFKLA